MLVQCDGYANLIDAISEWSLEGIEATDVAGYHPGGAESTWRCWYHQRNLVGSTAPVYDVTEWTTGGLSILKMPCRLAICKMANSIFDSPDRKFETFTNTRQRTARRDSAIILMTGAESVAIRMLPQSGANLYNNIIGKALAWARTIPSGEGVPGQQGLSCVKKIQLYNSIRTYRHWRGTAG